MMREFLTMMLSIGSFLLFIKITRCIEKFFYKLHENVNPNE